MKPLFFEVFSNAGMDRVTDEAFKDIRIERIVTNRDQSSMKVYIDGNKYVNPEEVYSAERIISSRLFSGHKMDVEIINMTIDVPAEHNLTEELPQKKKGNTKRTQKSAARKEKTGETKEKEKNENLIYGNTIKTSDPVLKVSELNSDSDRVVLEVRVFNKDIRKLNSGKCLLTLSLTDDTDSIIAKIFLEEEDAKELFAAVEKEPFIRIRGTVAIDKYDGELCLLSVRGIEKTGDLRQVRMDNAPEKRVELHCHTQMSDMDAVINVADLMKRVAKWGHSAIAITDHGSVQSFPDAAKAAGKFAKGVKVIYGMEAYICDDTKPLVHFANGPKEYDLSGEMVVFDLETTGLNASREKIIEIGAVKVKDGEVVDVFSTFVNPLQPLSYEIMELTGINDNMLKDAPLIEEIFPKFMEFCKDLPLVAHNADFDTSCIKAQAKRLGLSWDMTYMDTVAIARILLPQLFRYKLDNVAKALLIPLDNHHRAVDDAMCTAHIYNKFVSMLAQQGINSLIELSEHTLDRESVAKKLFPAHATILATNDIGRINLYRMVSQSHLAYFHQIPRIPKSIVPEYREGILIGSGCSHGELFDALLSGKDESELERIVSFYDFLEVQPPCNNSLLMSQSKYGIRDISDIRALNDKIIALGERFGKPVVATSDAHYMDPEHEIYRRIILSEKKVAKTDVESTLFLRTTEEMLEEFAYLGKEKAYEIVVTNTNMISRMCEPISPVRPDKCPPVIENSDTMLREICYKKATAMYGEKLPEIVHERLEKELNSIISNGYALMYISAQKLVSKSNEDGYIVGSRGSVGSSLVATMAGISEVNPLPPHYICESCHYVEFDSEDIKKYANYAGCDLPDKVCPECGAPLKKDGFDIPFETFLGFKGNKEPDIDLNFSGDYLNKAHKYTEVIFGDGQTYRAGTVSTLADKTAYAYVKSYYEKKGERIKRCDIERRSLGCVGVRRTTGQHPGGIIVLPIGEEMESFTPVQHPANDTKTDIVTTHFDFHSIDSNLLKLDILGKDDPTQIKLLEEMTGVGVDDIPLDDKKVMSLFQETSALGLTPEDLMGIDFGTLGIPEFGTDFAMGILRDTKPQGIMDLVRIAGLSHGTDVYNGNAKELILEGTATLSTAICTRDDIMLYLKGAGVDPEESFTIMESVRKGKGLTPEWEEHMKAAGVPEWYITSCKKIQYMFPKAHAAAYVMMAYRLGYFKVYYPAAFYAAYFTIKATAFDYNMMCRGPEVLSHYLDTYTSKSDVSAKEKDAIRDMKVVYEMYKRGIEFLPIDLYESDAVYFKLKDGRILPPFVSIGGMGDKAAESLAQAARDAKFTSKDDIRDRGKLTQTVIDAMDELNLLEGFSKSNQLSFFDMINK